GDVRDDLVPILQANPEGGVGQRLDDGAFELDGVVFRHAFPICALSGDVKGGNFTRNPAPAQSDPQAPSREAGRVPKSAVHEPGRPGRATRSRSLAWKCSRGQRLAPSETRCGFSTCASSSGQPQACSCRASAARATLEPPDRALNMLSP